MKTPNRSDWNRVSRRRCCPICSKPGWCLFAGPEADPTAVICQRTESDKRCGEAGWLHRLSNDRVRTFKRSVTIRLTETPQRDLGDFARQCAATMKPHDCAKLADDLGLSVSSLQRLCIGWSSSHGAWTFPMRNADGDVVGIRLRLRDGSKLAVKGGREGLFIPDDLQPDGRLLICEGPTDTAAMVDLGYAAVGRPSCLGGIKPLVELVSRRKTREAVIVADSDGPGRRGAENLASVLRAYVVEVRLIEPPNGIKDARAWKQAGATSADVEATIAAASARTLKITTRKAGDSCKPMKD